jgi:hypothetical protein
MQILKYRQLLTRVNDDEFLKRAEERIAELEQQLQPSTAD